MSPEQLEAFSRMSAEEWDTDLKEQTRKFVLTMEAIQRLLEEDLIKSAKHFIEVAKNAAGAVASTTSTNKSSSSSSSGGGGGGSSGSSSIKAALPTLGTTGLVAYAYSDAWVCGECTYSNDAGMFATECGVCKASPWIESSSITITSKTITNSSTSSISLARLPVLPNEAKLLPGGDQTKSTNTANSGLSLGNLADASPHSSTPAVTVAATAPAPVSAPAPAPVSAPAPAPVSAPVSAPVPASAPAAAPSVSPSPVGPERAEPLASKKRSAPEEQRRQESGAQKDDDDEKEDGDAPVVGKPRKREIKEEAASAPKEQKHPVFKKSRAREDEDLVYRPIKRERKEDAILLRVTFGERLLELQIRPSDTIGAIKNKIYDLEPSLRPDRQVIIHRKNKAIGLHTIRATGKLSGCNDDTLPKLCIPPEDYANGSLSVIN